MTNRKKRKLHSDKEMSPTPNQTPKLQRIDRRYLRRQVQQIISVERGILYTTKELLFRPGKSIQTFLFENRDRHVKPIAFLIFTSIVFSLISYFWDIEYSYFNVNKIQGLQGKVSTGDFGEWLNNNIAYTNLIIGIFIALWIRLFVRNYNIYEILVMLCFVLGEATLLLSFALVVAELTNKGWIALGLMSTFLLYPIWAIGQFLGKHKLLNYFKSLLVVILGAASYLAVSLLFGYLWNLIQH